MVFAHQAYGLGLEHMRAVERAAVEQHAHEADVIRRGAVEPAAAHVEFRVLFDLERNGGERAVRAALMHGDEALTLRCADAERRIGHAKRRENVVR